MSFVRASEFYEELREARSEIAMAAVARVLLNPELLNKALAETGLLMRDGKKLPEDSDYLKFVMTEFDPKVNLVNAGERFFSYVNSVLQGSAKGYGYNKETLLNERDNKTVEAMLLYAACFKVEADFEMNLTGDYLAQTEIKSRCGEGTVAEKEALKKLEIIKNSSLVISAGNGLTDKSEPLLALVRQMVKSYQTKSSAQQIPPNLKLEIIRTINEQVNEIRGWKNASLYQMLFGGMVNSLITEKNSKIIFLQGLLAADNLVGAQKHTVNALRDNRSVLDGRTLERATEVMAVKVDTNNVEMTVMDSSPVKSAMPDEPCGEDISPKNPRK